MNCAHKTEDFANAGPALSHLNAGLLQAYFQLFSLLVPATQLSTLLSLTPEPDVLGSLLGLQSLNFEQQFWLFECPCSRSVTDLIYDGYLFLLGLIKAP